MPPMGTHLIIVAAVCASATFTLAAPPMSALMSAYTAEELSPTTNPTQVALCPPWSRTEAAIEVETNSRVETSRSVDFNLSSTVATFTNVSNVEVATEFAAEYSAARARRADVPMPPATAFVAASGNEAELLRLFLVGVRAGSDAAPIPTTLPTTVPVTLTLPPGVTIPDDATNLTLPGGVRLTLPGQATLPPLPSDIPSTLPGSLTLPPDLASQVAQWSTPDVAKLLSTIAATALQQTTLPGGTLPGGIRPTLPSALAGDMAADMETMAKGETMRATVARRRMRMDAPQCFVSAANPLSPNANTSASGAPRAALVDVTIRLRGSAFSQLMTTARRPSLEAALRADLATLMRSEQRFITIRALRVGSLIIDFSLDSASGVDASTAQVRAYSAAGNTTWIAAVQAEYATVSSETLVVESVNAAPGTPPPATTAGPTTAAAPATPQGGAAPSGPNIGGLFSSAPPVWPHVLFVLAGCALLL